MKHEPTPNVAAPDATSADAPAPSSDVLVLGGPTDDGEGARVLRVQDHAVSVGEIRPLAEGKSIHGEVVALTPRAESPRVCDVRTLYAPRDAPPADRSHAGPARVASAAFRQGWEAIFAKDAPDPRKN